MITLKNSNKKRSVDRVNLGARLLMLTLALTNLSQPAALSAEKPELGYDLEQKSLLIGTVTVRVCAKAVQITDHGRGVVYVSRAPDWKLQMINPAEKSYYEGKIDNFSGTMTQGVALFTGRMLTDATYQPPAKQPDGLLLYTTTAEFTKHETEIKKNVTNSNGFPKTIDVWTNPAIPAPPRAVKLLGRLFGFAAPPGIPSRVRYFDFDHEEKVYLKTFRITKKSFTDADFEKRLPAYKQVSTVAAVFYSKQQDEDVSDMLGGFTDGLSNKKH